MNEETIRGIVETAFKRCFGHVELVRIDVHPGFDHEDDPVVNLWIVYDDECGKVGSLGGDGFLNMLSEVHSEFHADPTRYPGFPLLHVVARSELGSHSSEAN